MSKRFGRNQRRKMLARIEKLESIARHGLEKAIVDDFDLHTLPGLETRLVITNEKRFLSVELEASFYPIKISDLDRLRAAAFENGNAQFQGARYRIQDVAVEQAAGLGSAIAVRLVGIGQNSRSGTPWRRTW